MRASSCHEVSVALPSSEHLVVEFRTRKNGSGEREARRAMDGEAAAATTTTTRSDRWGHQVRTTSDACIAAVDSYYEQFLSYGRNRAVILQALLHDPSCVLSNAHAAHFLAPKNPSKASSLLAAAASSLVLISPPSSSFS